MSISALRPPGPKFTRRNPVVKRWYVEYGEATRNPLLVPVRQADGTTATRQEPLGLFEMDSLEMKTIGPFVSDLLTERHVLSVMAMPSVVPSTVQVIEKNYDTTTGIETDPTHERGTIQ